MPLVKVDAADDYLDVAHLAEEKGNGGGGKGTAGRRHAQGKLTSGSGNKSNLDPDALVDVPAFSSSNDAPRGAAAGGLFGSAGISSMIAPRYLARDSHARPRDVQVAQPTGGLNDSQASLDDNVSIITMETCLRTMDAGGLSVSGELSEREMALAAARGEYNARIAAMSRQNSEKEEGGEGDADARERQNAYGANRIEDGLKGDLGRSGTSSSAAGGAAKSSASNQMQLSDEYFVPYNDSYEQEKDQSSPTGRAHRGDRRDQYRQRHHKDTGAATGGRSSRLHNRSSLQDRYRSSTDPNASGRSQLTNDTTPSSPSNARHLHSHLKRQSDPATSMQTIEASGEASQSSLSMAESKASHRTHNTQERATRGLGASMWSASLSREDRLKEQRRVRSRSRDRGAQIMNRVLKEEHEEEDEEEEEDGKAEAEKRSRRHREGSDEEEKKEGGGGGATGTSSNGRHHSTRENHDDVEHHDNVKDRRPHLARRASLADEVNSFSSKEIARRRDYLTQKKLERERSGDDAPNDERSHDGTASLVESISNLRGLRAAGVGLNSTKNTLRQSFTSLDDELDEVDEEEEEATAGGPVPSLPKTATRMMSASNTLSSFAAEVSSSARFVSSSAERGARGLLSRHNSSNIDAHEAARTIEDLQLQVNKMREAFQTAEDHVATLEGRLADATSDRDRAEDLIRLLEAENDALKKRVEELERREFGRAMGMTTSRAGSMNHTGNTFTVALNDTGTETKEKKDPLKGSLDALRKNRVQPFRQGSMKSFNQGMQDFDLESVVSEREPPKSTGSVATGNSGDSNQPMYEHGGHGEDQERRYNQDASYDSDDGSEDIADQIRSLPSGNNPDDNGMQYHHHQQHQQQEQPSSPTDSRTQKRGMFGLGKLMNHLHNESFAIMETLQEENTSGAKPEVPHGGSPQYQTDDPADVAGEISHKVSVDIREWGNADKDPRSQHRQLQSTASGDTAATSYMTNSTAPQTQAAGGSWFRRHRDSIAKGVNESLRHMGGTDVSDGMSLAGQSVVSTGGFSMNLSMKEELG